MKVCLLMPCLGSVPAKVWRASVALSVYTALRGTEVIPMENERAGIHRSRNDLAGFFLGTDAEWAFWMDSDMILPADTLERMLYFAIGSKIRIATGIYYERGDGEMDAHAIRSHFSREGCEDLIPAGLEKLKETLHMPVLFKLSAGNQSGPKYYADELPKGDEPFEVGAAGFGCMLTHRSVFEGMEAPYFKTNELGEDVNFCNRARANGHKILALPALKIGHIGTPPVIYGDEPCSRQKNSQRSLSPNGA